VHTLQLVRIGEVQVEEHAGRRGQQWLCLGDRPHPVKRDGGSRFHQEFLDEKGVPIIVLDQQHLHLAGNGRRGRDPGLRGVPSHRPAPFMAFVGVPSLMASCADE